MDAHVAAVAAEYRKRMGDEERIAAALPPGEIMSRLDDFLLPVGEETATFLGLLIRSATPRRIVEIGTSYGYSTLYLADAARAVGAKLTTLELSAKKSQYARDAITRAGLADAVDFRVGDALELLQTLPGPFDFVLIDLWKDLYVPCLNLVAPQLSSGAYVIADNMIFPEQARPAATAYQLRVRELGLDSVLLTIGSGLEVSRKP
jgi:predicted O-methyltransferase YrrM